MNDREKLLAAAVAAVVALWAADLGWAKYGTALEKNLNQQRITAQSLSEARTAAARGKRAQQKLHQWQKQSLPTDLEIAKSLYQDWLQQQLNASGLKVIDLNPRNSGSSSKRYLQFSFAVKASGTLEQFTGFLYKFYRAPHLQRISAADLSPSDDRKTLEISLTVDALSLGEGDREDRLAEGTNDDFKQSLNEFRDDIVKRNLFATYQPASTPQAEVAKADTEAAQAKFSGINYGQEGWQISVRMEKSGQVYYYREGDTIEIGQFKGTIERLDGERREAIVTSESRRLLFRLGQTLAEAQPLGESAS